MRWILLATLLATLTLWSVGPATAKKDHRRGCNTTACDQRVDRAWAKKHPMRVALASWYGPGFYGNRTACGQVLTGALMGVAHKTLPCGTRLRICRSGCAWVRVLDRGPFVAGREFDLAPAVKAAIGCGDLCVVRWRPHRRR